MTVAARVVPERRAIGLDAIGMRKVFGPLVALDDVTLKVPSGSFHALLGENGAGKSTLVKCIMGFYQPDAGQVLWTAAREPSPTRARQRRRASAWSTSISRWCLR